MSSYTRQDQVAVREAYLQLQEEDGVCASAARAARRAEVGCSRTTAQRWLKSEGVLRGRGEASNANWRAKYGEDWERLALYVEKGWTCEEVAERFDVSTQKVHTAAKRAGINMNHADRRHRRAWDPSTPRGRKRQKRVRRMAELARRKSKTEAAEHFDITRRHLNRLLASPLNPYNSVTYDSEASYS